MAKRNKRYWQERAAEHRKIIDKDAEQIIRETQAAYERSLHHIDGEIARWYQRFADAEEITMEEARQRMNAGELNQFRMTLEEYIARGEQLDLDPSWADALEKASALHHIDRYDAMRTIIRAEMEELKAKTRGAGWMDQIAEDAYLHMIYSMSREMQMAIAFNQPAIERLKQLVKEPWAPDGVDFAKRADINMDKLAAEITKKLQQACITGQPYRELAADIEKTVGLKAYEAERIIRTECTNISSLSEQAAYNTAGIEEYEVLVTLDAKTCELCGQMDGHVEAVEKMEPGVNAPPFHPNCRCTTIGHYEDGIDETRIARDENGKTIYVPGDMTWAEWKAMYDNGEAPGQNAPTEPEIKTKQEALDYFAAAGMPIKDGKKYKMDEEMAVGYANWHVGFSKQFQEFTEMARTAKSHLPIIEHVAPSKIGKYTLGQFSYRTSGESLGIKLNGGSLHSFELAKSGSESSKASGWHSTGSPFHTFIHEYGHYVSHSMHENVANTFEHDIIRESVQEFKKNHPEYTRNTYVGLKDDLSRYGSTSEAECFAEAFAEYFGSDEPREFARIFGKKLEKALRAVK